MERPVLAHAIAVPTIGHRQQFRKRINRTCWQLGFDRAAIVGTLLHSSAHSCALVSNIILLVLESCQDPSPLPTKEKQYNDTKNLPPNTVIIISISMTRQNEIPQ
jgi:hypothetical protein